MQRWGLLSRSACVFWVWGMWFLFVLSCGGGAGVCVNGVQLSEYNPSGLQCTEACDCSNLKYEGYCISGLCIASPRNAAQRKGEVRSCKLLQKVGTCEEGTQEAQPTPLKELLWGDCVPPMLTPENTRTACLDGKDNDCNGLVDLNEASCAAYCQPGQQAPCYTGSVESLNQGRCRAGIKTCSANNKWGGCVGEVRPMIEVCDAQDDDCNGLIDDGLSGCATTQRCAEGTKKPCYSGLGGCAVENGAGGASFRCIGACRAGEQRCVGGAWTACAGQVVPQAEACDGKDKDCDGKVDEGCGCSSDAQCSNGTFCSRGVCQPRPSEEIPVEPTPEAPLDGGFEANHDAMPEMATEPKPEVAAEASKETIPDKTLHPNEVLIPAGTFVMGSPTTELGRGKDEPQRQVTLTRSFYMGKYEVRQSEFQAVMGYNPSKFPSCGGNCPADNVDWHEAAAYCNAMSRTAGLAECFTCISTGPGAGPWCDAATAYKGANYYNCRGFRLPTEAEWEYAYRAGTTTALYNGGFVSQGCTPLEPNPDALAWYCGNAQSKTHAVGEKLPNAWGLHDMSGNVSEWCYDVYSAQYAGQSTTDPVGESGPARVRRGGSWNSYVMRIRAASRWADPPTATDSITGFRVVRTAP